MKRLPLLYDLIAREVIIIALTDGIIFCLMSIRHTAITWQLTMWVIAVTLVPLIVSTWFDLWRYGVLKVR
jgi:hypothetical protein